MRSMKELKGRLDPKNGFERRYDMEVDDKVHLLYVSPRQNATGYHRMISPALEINKTTTHKAIVTSIEGNDFSKRLSDLVNQLDERLAIWADYIIFPPLFGDISYLVGAIRALNPSVQLTMDVDKNYFAMPDCMPLSRKLTQEKLQAFQFNLGLMDLVTVANEAFQNFLQRLIDDRLEESNVLVHHLPSLVSRHGYEEMPPLQKNETDALRIGLIKPTEENLTSLREVLFRTKASHGGKIQFACLGKPHSSKEGDLLLKAVDCEMHDTVSFLDYFEKLNALRLDLVLLPAKEGLYDRHQNNHLFLELSVFGIPAIASIHHPAKAQIEEGETGHLASEVPEWIEGIEALFKDKPLRERMGRNAMKRVWLLKSYNSKTIEEFTSTFI